MQVARDRVADFGKWQQPKYLLAPDFSILPPPDGPLALGKFVEDTIDCSVLNNGSAGVPISESDIYSDVKTGVETIVNSSLTYETQTLAKFLDRNIGGNAKLKGHKADSKIFKFQKLETIYFYPTKDYIRQCRALADIYAYLEYHKYEKPIYLITGLKVAWGATYSIADGQEFSAGAGAAVTLGTEELNVEVKGEGSRANSADFATKVCGPGNFVLGIRLLKFFHRRKYYLFGKMMPFEKPETTQAVLLDASYGANDEDDELVPMEMSDEEAAKMVL